jgi:hypothetical protein
MAIRKTLSAACEYVCPRRILKGLLDDPAQQTASLLNPHSAFHKRLFEPHRPYLPIPPVLDQDLSDEARIECYAVIVVHVSPTQSP